MMGNVFSHHNEIRKQLQDAVNELFERTHAATLQSQEVAAFSRRKNTS